ncbi:MAG: lycopene cyclase domain-containing protein [Chitinophagales bacterium]
MKITYLLIDFFTIIVPLLFSFHPKLNFHKNWKAFFLGNLVTLLLFAAWDIYFTHLGVWGFNPRYVTGLYVSNLPVEEILFFVCIPYACVFTYHCLNIFVNIRWNRKFETGFIIVFASALLIAGIYNHDKLYTASTFISLSGVLLLLKFVLKVKWLPKLLSIYPLLLIPFFVVNGILTGSGLQQPVVWYNDAKNLGARLLSIPVEDIFYGFEMILVNVFFYEYFISSSTKKAPVNTEASS